ncbi:Asp23/Gls24 family envelope stress response protein [Inconstantimicrobium mannanitabidum]|uniref:Uncharacterized protein n=1 Tax=Inconstantimicrobium mannanitabidum TaxID=1604901 RepID=A0ACB5RAD8_9CLOT|nr:Asp23/Gls24 family envelope stress response protein [Clostridium sp. TW13]GKX66153.1 hypothetical protein rsdtw13_14110 [Clostridium sp. TW13]
MEEFKNNENNIGTVKISDEVISVIAGIAASEIKGVFEVSQGVASGITQIFTNKKNPSKAVKVEVEEDRATIEISVGVQYGINIPDVLAQVQENVKNTVEALTGLNVSAVNILVQSIVLPKTNGEQSQE